MDSDGKESTYNVGDLGSIPGSGRSPGEWNGNPLQYSCLENPMDRGAWQATVHGIAKSWTWLSIHTHTHTNTYNIKFIILIISKCISSVVSNALLISCYQQHYLSLALCIIPNWNSVPTEQYLLIPSHGCMFYFYDFVWLYALPLWFWLLYMLYINGIIQDLSFCVLLISLSIA